MNIYRTSHHTLSVSLHSPEKRRMFTNFVEFSISSDDVYSRFQTGTNRPNIRWSYVPTYCASSNPLSVMDDSALMSKTLFIECFSKTFIDFFTERSVLFYEPCFTQRHLWILPNLCVYSP